MFDTNPPFAFLKSLDTGSMTSHVTQYQDENSPPQQSTYGRTARFLKRVTPDRFPCNMTPIFWGVNLENHWRH